MPAPRSRSEADPGTGSSLSAGGGAAKQARTLGHAVALTLTLALAAALPGGALAASPADVPTRSWHFELPTLEGERFVRSSELPMPALINVWGRDCPPCVAELPLLQRFAAQHPDWGVVLIATDAPLDARRFLQTRGVTLPNLRAGAGLSALLRAAGNARGVLPYTVVLQGERICASHAGMLTDADLQSLVTACAPSSAAATPAIAP